VLTQLGHGPTSAIQRSIIASLSGTHPSYPSLSKFSPKSPSMTTRTTPPLNIRSFRATPALDPIGRQVKTTVDVYPTTKRLTKPASRPTPAPNQETLKGKSSAESADSSLGGHGELLLCFANAKTSPDTPAFAQTSILSVHLTAPPVLSHPTNTCPPMGLITLPQTYTTRTTTSETGIGTASSASRPMP
jgi:hypothetical protein